MLTINTNHLFTIYYVHAAIETYSTQPMCPTLRRW